MSNGTISDAPTAWPTATPTRTTLPPTLHASVSSEQLRTTVAIYGSIGAFCIILHAFLRTYARRKYSPRERHVPAGLAAPEVPRVPWRWFVPLLYPKCDSLVLEYAGLDAYVTIRFISLSCKLFAILAPLGLVVLGSVYATQGDEANLTTASRQELSMLTLQYVTGNGGVGTNLMWLPCVFVYIFTGIGIALLHREYVRIVPLQREYLLYKHQSTYSIVVERIPPEIHSRRALKRYFESLFPGSVRRIDIVPMGETASKLKDLVSDRKDVLMKLERAMLLEYWNNKNQTKEDPTIGGAIVQDTEEARRASESQQHEDLANRMDAWKAKHVAFREGQRWMGSRFFCEGWLCHLFGNGEKVLSVQHYTRELDSLNERVAALQKTLRREIYSERDARYSGQDPSQRQQHDHDDNEQNMTAQSLEHNLERTSSTMSSQSSNAFEEIALENNEASPPQDMEGTGGDDWHFGADKIDEAEWLLGDHSYDRYTLARSVAFVTFNNKTASTAVGRCMKSEVHTMIVHPAPEPEDVNWSRLGCHPNTILATRVSVVVLNILLLLLFGVLTSTISVTTNLATIRERWAALDEWLDENTWGEPIIDQIAPLLLVILFALVPPILNLILKLRFDLSHSDRENSFFINYSVFLVFQLFLFFQITGAVFNVFAATFDNPREFVDLLAQMIPANATFFMQFIAIRMFWVLPGAELLRIGNIAVALLVKPIFCGIARTPRERRDDCCGCRPFGTPGDAWYGVLCSSLYLVLCIGVTYSVIAPLVLVFAFGYFAIALIVYRNQLLYVFIKNRESGGSMWRYLAIAYLVAFLIMHLTMLGIFALSEGVAQSVLMIPPLLFTCGYASFLYSMFDSSNSFVNLSDARRFDIRSESRPDQYTAPPPPDFSYPSLRAPAEVAPTSVPDMVKELHEMKDENPGLPEHSHGPAFAHFGQNDSQEPGTSKAKAKISNSSSDLAVE